MVITDLDGTLLRSDRTVSAEDYKTLTDLKENGVVRVIATGRSPFSFSRVIRDDFPVDYLVFSSGVGVMNFQTREILTTHSLPAEKVRELAALFQSKGISFKVLAPVPDNHHYHYYETGHSHPDFYRRMEYYRGFETPISFSPPNFGKASQLLIIMPPDVALFESLKAECKG
ncbi:MAG: HAD hydrolase family protein, partial [Bacteroidales bacterium]|nr:HAD hydrolase family protein [Bacteroidales bacterium]